MRLDQWKYSTASMLQLSAIALAVALAPGTSGVYAENASPDDFTGVFPDDANLSALKDAAASAVDANAKLAQVMNDTIFSFAEPGFQEFETSKYITGVLEQNGFTIEREFAGVPTGWKASWTNGNGGPVIALGSDIDDIPKASQYPGLPYHKPMVEGAPGHGEGHNSGQPVITVAALAVKDLMEKNNIPGTLMLWPGVAEELLGAKAFFVRDGMFDGVDAVIFVHVSNTLRTSWGQPNGTGMVSVGYTFHGESAHSAGAPWRGRSALDGVDLMNMAWNVKREHLRPEQRSHFVITDGGDQPNVVPSIASVWYYVREMDRPHIQENYDTLNKIAEAAAQMTNTTVERTFFGQAYQRHFNKPMAEAAYENIKKVGMPQWDDNDQAFAKAVQQMSGSPQTGMPDKPPELAPPPANPSSGGSDDIGDVSYVVPTITVNYPSNIAGLPGHSWQNAIAMATPIAHKGVVAGAKVVAMTTLDLLTKPELLEQAKGYFDQVQSQDPSYPYEPFFTAEDKPTIHRNEEMMKEFRPQLEQFYYDSSKYDTYLDQLGIHWPTLEAPAQ